jgi:hypothetical protein
MFARLLLLSVVIAVAGCDKVTDENLDKWTHTEKGPEKLKKALADESIDPDLSAHAAANMVKKQMEADVRAGFEAMSSDRRQAVIAKLAPRLWELAKVDAEDKLPAPPQISAKDMLFNIRKWAAPADQKTIDDYLVSWYCVKSYEERAKSGAHLGPEVLRAVGPAAGKKLIEVVNSLIAAPGQDKVKFRIGDELMLGMAASGDPDAVKKLVDIARMSDRADKTLPDRAMDALHLAYIDPKGLFPVREAKPLEGSIDGLTAIAKDEKSSAGASNDAIDLIAALGPPTCIQPLLSMVAYPHSDQDFKYVAASRAIRCGGLAAAKDAVEALPQDQPYDAKDLQGAISGEIAKLSPKAKAQEVGRDLLGSKSKLGKWVGIEILLATKSTEDVSKIAALSNDHDKLQGYWGEGASKPDPTLGDRAKEVAAQLAGK